MHPKCVDTAPQVHLIHDDRVLPRHTLKIGRVYLCKRSMRNHPATSFNTTGSKSFSSFKFFVLLPNEPLLLPAPECPPECPGPLCGPDPPMPPCRPPKLSRPVPSWHAAMIVLSSQLLL